MHSKFIFKVASFFLLLFLSAFEEREARLLSSLDQRYKLRKIEKRANQYGLESEGVSFYQRILRKTLGSHCTFFPNDSRYIQIYFKKCGSLKAILKGIQKYYSEVDAPNQQYDIILQNNKIYYVDLPEICSF